ncbi:chorismate transformation enzyme, FkbO/Hyg5 family [Aquabacterium sp. OR-4]|uniref:chorismate transformation enzyme, FkbO/Hyg5 family n=1 Tax=Aquabacterium sp. OR-4 TaxID=2978127 RepID=UPI0028C8AD9E|nr:Rid family hydrolase [Aquabacterium sp. OR-4]MDT7834835.1 hypothetical protein [Aquabacterium sp. OR-4]
MDIRVPPPAAHSSSPLPALRVQRFAASAAPPAPLGQIDYAQAGLRVLAGDGVDAWCAGDSLREGRQGLLQWRDDGHWLFGSIDLPEQGRSLAALAEAAYAEVFSCLAAHGRPLVRTWNYLPRIHDDCAGLERYRQFNAGRQAAFIAAGVDNLAGAPAACCLGTADGGLSLRFLAGHCRVQPLENPRQVPAWRYSRRWGPKSPTFSRAVLMDAGGGRTGLLISGTASIVGEESQHEGDVQAQTAETLDNLRAVLAAARAAKAGLALDLDALELTVYLRRPADLPQVRALLQAAAPAAAARALWLQADICRRELLVEIEAHALA